MRPVKSVTFYDTSLILIIEIKRYQFCSLIRETKMSWLKNPFVAFDQLSNKCLLMKLTLAINGKPHLLQLFQNEKL